MYFKFQVNLAEVSLKSLFPFLTKGMFIEATETEGLVKINAVSRSNMTENHFGRSL